MKKNRIQYLLPILLLLHIPSSTYEDYPSSSGNTIKKSLFVTGAVVSISAICYALARCIGNSIYSDAENVYTILSGFQQNQYDYKGLTKKARNLYLDKCGYVSSSLTSNYPVVWLAKRAASAKSCLAMMIFSTRMRALSKNLANTLRYLGTEVDQFEKERAEYNEKLREQRYRNSKLAIEREKLHRKYTNNCKN